MEGNIEIFKPKTQLGSEGNLSEFVRFCREDLTIFGEDLKWEENYWPSARAVFGNLDNNTRKLDTRKTLKEPFLSFGKAYFRYSQGFNPTKYMPELRALRCIERALLELTGEAHVVCLNSGVLDRAAELAREYYSHNTSYRVGQQLQKIAKFVYKNNLCPGDIDWANSIPRPNDRVLTGKKAKEEREKRLPDEEAIDAVAEIFASNPSHPRDIFTTSVCAMLLCAPSRVSEILALPNDCELWETKRDGQQAYGWRFQPGKGADPYIKWIPDNMVSLAQEAIRRVRLITEEARRIGKWHEENLSEFYPHSNCLPVAQNLPLSRIQVIEALGFGGETPKRANHALRHAGFSTADEVHTLGELQSWVRARLPKNFPWFDKERGIRCSEALFCFQRYQLHAWRMVSPVLIDCPNNNRVTADLQTGPKSVARKSKSLFDRNGYNDDRKQPLKLNTHSLRHLLNTMSQRGGLDQYQIARWSGRTDIKQNRVYDHMSEGELVDMIRKHDPSLTFGNSLNEVAEQIGKKLPMSQKEFNSLEVPTAHITEFGFCIHDFTISPCKKFRDCLNCSEQICVKGDRRLERIKNRYSEVKRLREEAEREIAEGSAGADRWYEIHALTEARLEELLGILTKPSIPDGSLVKLRNQNEFSPLRRAIDAKGDSGLEDPEEKELLEDIRNKLGGGFG